MQSIIDKQIQLSALQTQFKLKCLRMLNKQPQQYLTDFLAQSKDNKLLFDISIFSIEHMRYIQILFSLPIKNIHFFQKKHQSPAISTSLYENQNSKLVEKVKSLKQRQMQKQKQKRKVLLQLIKILSKAVLEQKIDQLRVLKFQSVRISSLHLTALSCLIQKSKHLKQLTFVKCSLKDSHLQILKTPLSNNISINVLNLSFNYLAQCGGVIGKIIFQHSQRKTQILNFYQNKQLNPEFDISSTGLFQINLEGNRFNDKSVDDLITFLQDDQWIRLINLKTNSITQNGIKNFLTYLNSNSSIMNLDLRQNQGFNTKYSKQIFKKLKSNIQNYKKAPQQYINRKSLRKKNNAENVVQARQAPYFYLRQSTDDIKQNTNQMSQKQNYFKQFNKQPLKNNLFKNSSKQKAKTKLLASIAGIDSKNYHSQKKKMEEKEIVFNNKERTNFIDREPFKQFSYHKNTNKTQLQGSSKYSADKSQIKRQNSHYEDQELFECKRCNELQLRALKAQKASLQLQIELKKLKSFLSKNIDVSVIGSSSNKLNLQNFPQLNLPNINASTSFNKMNANQNQDQMLSKIQILMSQLTKIMQTVELYQNTQNTIEHGFQNVNSLSKTVSLYDKPKGLLEIQQEISEDQALNLQQFRQSSVSLIQKSTSMRENVLKLGRITSDS